jgi:parallel beta-helix repeat protein
MDRTSKIFALVLVGLFLASLVVLPPATAKSQFSNAIYIRSDGRIDPTIAPIQTSGSTYTFNSNIIGGIANTIIVQKNDIILDGAGHTLEGQGAKDSIGIDISNAHNITVQNFVITNFASCIKVQNSVNCKILQNSITTYSYKNGINLDEDGIEASDSSNDLISENSLFSYAELYVSQNMGLTVTNCFNETISENKVSGSWNDIFLYSTSNCTVSGNSISQSESGLTLRKSNNTQVLGNHVFETTHSDSHGTHANSGVGIDFYGDNYNDEFYQNNVSLNGYMIRLWENCLGNVFWDNCFQNNSREVDFLGHSEFITSWDNGSVGNYWSDYQSKYPNATEIDESGIGNTSYVIDENNTDHYPLWQAGINEIMPTPIPTNSIPTHSPTTGVLTLSLTIPIFAITAVILAFVISVLFYRRHRKITNQNK